MKNLIKDTQNLAQGQETTSEVELDKNILENTNVDNENLAESQSKTDKNFQENANTSDENSNKNQDNASKIFDDLTKTTQENTGGTGEVEKETNALNPRSLSFWIGLIAILLASLEGLLIMFNVNLEVNLLVEGLSTILFALVCMGILKTNNKNVSKQDIATSLEENLKSKKKKSQENKNNK